MIYNTRISSIVFCIALITTQAHAQSREQVLPFIPADANFVALLNVESLLESPVGVEKGWAAKHQDAYLDGALTIPPWVTQFVRAAHFSPDARGETWNVAFVPLDKESRLEQIAKAEGEEIQELRGLKSLYSPKHGGYFAEILPANAERPRSVIGLLAPASRQEASNWLATSHAGAKLSDYLKNCITDKEPQVVLALDMNDMLDPKQIRYRIDGSPTLKEDKLTKLTLTLNFQTLQGIRLAVTAKEELTAEIRLDFNRTIGPEYKFVKPLFLEFLQDAGAEIEDFANAEASVAGNSVRLTTPLSDVGFRKILSLVSTPHPASQTEAPPEPPTPSAATNAGYEMTASKRYFNAILKNLEDIEKTYLAKNGSYARSASWHLSYAKRIEHMPTKDVHPELQDFAKSMAHSLRVLGDSLRGSQVEIQNLDNQIQYSKEYKYEPKTGYEWWWGPARTPSGYIATPENTTVIVHTNLDEVRQKQQATAEAGAGSREQIWSNMAAERDAVQTDMIKVFGRNFLIP